MGTAILAAIGVFIGVLILLMLWSYFMCPHVVKVINFYEKMLQDWKDNMSEVKKKEDPDKDVGELDKWY